ncbi:MAG: AAA family ATPase [Blastocatellia bacterium]|nr:AAA family ATPase [Blastocatellia bacterium]
MHIKSVRIKSYKRFTDLTIDDLPPTTRLVVLIGPNGCGKSSLFDAIKTWHHFNNIGGWDEDKLYHLKAGSGTNEPELRQSLKVDFCEPLNAEAESRNKYLYFRSAYRNQADFSTNSLQRINSIFDAPKIRRLIDNDVMVDNNYLRLVSATVEGIYSGEHDTLTVRDLRDFYIGEIQESMKRLFDDLVLKGTGDPLVEGSFYFDKNLSKDFHYKNLSGGEKAAFDIILDLIVKRKAYDDTVYFIDEPEAHMHTKLQSRLLEEIIRLIPQNCQLWIATHSIGMMRKARDLYLASPNEVVFLDFQGQDFDKPINLKPAIVNRELWAKTLSIALDDLAHLIAPKRIVLCEGRPLSSQNNAKAELDAKCYRIIFENEYPDTDFLSVGNSSDVQSDRLELGKAIQTLVSGTSLIRVIDQDDRSPEEIVELQKEGVRVLSRRHLESYLMDDEILSRLCAEVGKPEKEQELLVAKQQEIQASIARGNPRDDIKSAAGKIYTEAKKILELQKCGNTVDAFKRDTLAKLVTPNTKVYTELKKDIFNE